MYLQLALLKVIDSAPSMVKYLHVNGLNFFNQVPDVVSVSKIWKTLVWDKGRVCFKVEQIYIAVMDAAIALLCHIYRFQILSSRCQKSAVYIGLPTGKKKNTRRSRWPFPPFTGLEYDTLDLKLHEG